MKITFHTLSTVPRGIFYGLEEIPLDKTTSFNRGEASSLGRQLRIINRLHKLRAICDLWRQTDGVSIQEARRAANNAAVNLLNSLSAGFDGAKLATNNVRFLPGIPVKVA
uniref:hypothetical protein n=1 Tax=Salmonella sp. TaxID=599 RepID=UPI001CDA0BDE|nr:hypothetical protein [Salmonella sp.]